MVKMATVWHISEFELGPFTIPIEIVDLTILWVALTNKIEQNKYERTQKDTKTHLSNKFSK